MHVFEIDTPSPSGSRRLSQRIAENHGTAYKPFSDSLYVLLVAEKERGILLFHRVLSLILSDYPK